MTVLKVIIHLSIYLHLYNCHVHYVESHHFLLMENTTHLSTCPIIMGVESYLSEYIGTRGCLDDWNIWITKKWLRLSITPTVHEQLVQC